MRTSFSRVALSAGLAAFVAGCGSMPELPFLGAKDERLVGDREAVFASSSPPGEGGTANIGPASSNSDWAQPGGNAENDPGHVAFSGGGARAWRANVGSTNFSAGTRGTLRIASRPVKSGDRVFVYAPDGSVTALSAGSGSRVWRTSLRPENENDSAAGGGVAVDGGRVYAATGFGQVAALDAGSGEVIWTRDVETPLRSAPTASGGKVFVVSQKNEVFAINQADGTEAFTYAGIPEQAGLLAAASPAVSGDTVVIPYSSGEVMGFSVSSGEPRWQTFVTSNARTSGMSGLPDVSGSPVVDNGTVYATGVAGRTIAVSLSDGVTRWSTDIGSAHTPVVSGNALFLVDLSGRMVALDRTTGDLLWARELPRPRAKRDDAYAGPVLAGGSLWALSNDGRLAQVDPATGQLVSDKSVASGGFMSPIVAGGQMIIVSNAGEISALR